MAPNAAAIAVFTATTVKRRSVAANVDAALKPNQPNSRMNVPSIAIGMLCAGKRTRLAVGPELADASTEHERAREAATPPIACTTPEPAKST